MNIKKSTGREIAQHLATNILPQKRKELVDFGKMYARVFKKKTIRDVLDNKSTLLPNYPTREFEIIGDYSEFSFHYIFSDLEQYNTGSTDDISIRIEEPEMFFDVFEKGFRPKLLRLYSELELVFLHPEKMSLGIDIKIKNKNWRFRIHPNGVRYRVAKEDWIQA